MKLNIMEEVGGNLSRGSLTVLEMERIGNILPRSHTLDQITCLSCYPQSCSKKLYYINNEDFSVKGVLMRTCNHNLLFMIVLFSQKNICQL